MKKLLSVLLIACLALSLSVPALAESTPANVITVAGNATISLAADMATLQIGAEIRRTTVDQAQRECSDIIAEVVKVAKDNGIADKDIITSYFNINTWNDYDVLNAEGKPTVTYVVSSMLSITVRDLSIIGKLVDDATKVGANATYGLTFISSQANDAYLKALTRAVEDAQVKATVLAEAAGLMVGDIVTIDASKSEYYYGISNTFEAKGVARDGATIISGDVTVSASVNVTYGIIR